MSSLIDRKTPEISLGGNGGGRTIPMTNPEIAPGGRCRDKLSLCEKRLVDGRYLGILVESAESCLNILTA